MITYSDRYARQVEAGFLRVGNGRTDEGKPVITFGYSDKYHTPGCLLTKEEINNEKETTMFALVINDKRQAESIIRILQHIIDTEFTE